MENEQNILYMPSKARNENERRLRDDINEDLGLKNPDLKRRALEYMSNRFSLVFWYHILPMVRCSFEENDIAARTREAHCREPTMPRIIGIVTSAKLESDMADIKYRESV